jgi:predicted sulfurtransferase/predicted O-methyltransferase YrrM
MALISPMIGNMPVSPFFPASTFLSLRCLLISNYLFLGYDMPALEWHERLKEEMERRNNTHDTNAPGVRLLDCRNFYETDVGRFEGSEPLETHTFRDSWDALKERLADTPKDAHIMTYCTGGIRCVKVGAYLTQELGFTNVSRLAGGIIAYDRILNEKAPTEKPMFKGTNFVFDGRLGRPITEDSLGKCITCQSETSAVSNCRNENCHQRIVQCEDCRTAFSGTCSDACKHRLLNGAMRYRRNSVSDSPSETPRSTFKTLDEYSRGHSSPLPSIYPEMELNTRSLIPSGAHMISGSAQGKLLTQFASMTRNGRILELGTFTGYGTACLLEGAGLAGRVSPTVNTIGTRESGPYVLTMERDARAYDVAVSQISIIAELGMSEAAAESLCALRANNRLITNTSDTALVSLVYDSVITCELLKVSDGLAIVEEMSAGRGDLQPAPFDLVFLDADKTRLLEYTEALLSSDRVLKPGGMIVVDNVLWKGLVIEASSGTFSSFQESDSTEEEVLRRNRRARKLATKMHRFNSEIVKDCRVDVLVLPLRDGLSVIRKK